MTRPRACGRGTTSASQYRSALYWTTPAQQEAALASNARYQMALAQAGVGGRITTEVAEAGPFYYAETYHQQYLARNPRGYCGIGGTGVACPIGTRRLQAEQAQVGQTG